MNYQRVEEDHSVVHDSEVFSHKLIVSIEVSDQFKAFLLSVNHYFIEMRSA